MPPTLITQRLVLRPWRPEDLDPYVAICADTRVMRFLGDGMTKPKGQVLGRVALIAPAWENDGIGPLAVVEQATSKLIGLCGLSVASYIPNVEPSIEIGYRLAHDAWGKGLATEAARAAIDWGFSNQTLDQVVALVPPANRAAQRVADKLGMESTGKIRLGPATKPITLVVNRVSRARWDSQE